MIPYLDYCDVVYMVANESDLKKLQLIQNMACHTILMADERTSVKDMHANLNLLTLSNRRTFKLNVIKMYTTVMLA